MPSLGLIMKSTLVRPLLGRTSRVIPQHICYSFHNTNIRWKSDGTKGNTDINTAKVEATEQEKHINIEKAAGVTLKGNLLSDSKYEQNDFKMELWKDAVAQNLIKVFRLDMDRIRAGPVAGSMYYGRCKEQGLLVEVDGKSQLTKLSQYWYSKLGLDVTFASWFQITALHTWILFVRMRAMPFKYGKNFQQKLVDRFFKDIELRLANEMRINSGRIRDQYLREFHTQFRGMVLSYDEGFSTSDLNLAFAVWRNLYNANQRIDYWKLELIVRYIRMQLYVLSKMSDREFGFGKFEFVPADEIVYRLTPEEELELKKKAHEMFDEKKMKPSERSTLSLDN